MVIAGTLLGGVLILAVGYLYQVKTRDGSWNVWNVSFGSTSTSVANHRQRTEDVIARANAAILAATSKLTENSMQTWREKKPSSYDVTLDATNHGFASEEVVGTIVVVRNERVVRAFETRKDATSGVRWVELSKSEYPDTTELIKNLYQEVIGSNSLASGAEMIVSRKLGYPIWISTCVRCLDGGRIHTVRLIQKTADDPVFDYSTASFVNYSPEEIEGELKGAINDWHQAATQGDAIAQLMLGLFSMNTVSGSFPLSEDRARWIELAASNGIAEADRMLNILSEIKDLAEEEARLKRQTSKTN